MIDRAEAVIDMGALRANLRMLRARVSPAELMFVVKDDAYCHGLERIVDTAAADGITWFGALDAETALRVRRRSPEARVFAWLTDPDGDLGDAIGAGVEVGLSNVRQLRHAASAASTQTARVHLKIDTGLHRAGATPEDWPTLVREALRLQCEGRVEIAGAWTHLAEASFDADSLAISRFEAAVAAGEELGATFPVRHLAASAAAFERADSRFDLVRVGAFAYGIAPGDGVTPGSLGLVPVMTLRSVVREVKGDRAIVGIGYGDGLFRSMAGRVTVSVGSRRRVISKIDVDELVLTGCPDVAVGDVVTLFGDGTHGEATLQEWADALGTIGEEIAVRVSPRVPRRYLGAMETAD
ncbi:alanine racemase [Salinibacterium sp. SYSU T00001]|uniref:alanine racemase n=1 Tax=Homoserinimonas sedimenticola TaxID=2986805 RepID=UPI0022359405|nr:alanine racemase [Salinibacterium sedimenticola]MCW4384507.1 alanine racemase [Salinibacterium sedimenticola]